MKTRIIKWAGFYVPQYQKRYFIFFKYWQDFKFYENKPYSYIFQSKEKAQEFLNNLNEYYDL